MRDVTSEAVRTTKGEKLINNSNEKNGNKKSDKFKTFKKEKCMNKTGEIDYEEELKKSNMLVSKLRKGNEIVCVEHDESEREKCAC